MILLAMTVQEIYKEVFEDIQHLKNKLAVFRKDFGKRVLKFSHYPLSMTYVYTTSKKKSLFTIDFTALKRWYWNNPLESLHLINSQSEGKYAVTLTFDMDLATIYPLHFFKKYWKRILKDESIPNGEFIG